MRTHKTFKTALPLLLITLTIAISSFIGLTEILSYSQNIELKGTRHLKTDIKFHGGTINISTHKESFAEFKSEYSKPNWKAEVKWDAQNNLLNIHQPEEKNSNVDEKGKNDWRIKLPDNLESNPNINIGGGLGEFDLSNSMVGSIELHAGGGSFNLILANSSVSSINANVGGGSLTVDLTGKHDKDIKGKIILGAGLLQITLPSLSGIRIKVSGARGNKGGLKEQNGYYVNELYGKASHNIDLEVTNGPGVTDIQLR
jgi:hypothetical protein